MSQVRNTEAEHEMATQLVHPGNAVKLRKCGGPRGGADFRTVHTEQRENHDVPEGQINAFAELPSAPPAPLGDPSKMGTADSAGAQPIAFRTLGHAPVTRRSRAGHTPVTRRSRSGHALVTAVPWVRAARCSPHRPPAAPPGSGGGG